MMLVGRNHGKALNDDDISHIVTNLLDTHDFETIPMSVLVSNRVELSPSLKNDSEAIACYTLLNRILPVQSFCNGDLHFGERQTL